MELLEAIVKRRSVRAYREGRIARETVLEILRAGTLAPSGKNGQPWRFAVVQENRARFAEIAALTVYRAFAERADCLVLVFLDKAESYHYVKDCQAIGACIENMLLRATDLGIGACWVGEILNRDGAVKGLLGLSDRYDLMAAVFLGEPGEVPSGVYKKKPEECLLSFD